MTVEHFVFFVVPAVATTALVRFSLHQHNGAASVVTGKAILLGIMGCIFLIILGLAVWQLCRCLRDTREILVDPDVVMVMAPASDDDDDEDVGIDIGFRLDRVDVEVGTASGGAHDVETVSYVDPTAAIAAGHMSEAGLLP
jgi:hypothetical protein